MTEERDPDIPDAPARTRARKAAVEVSERGAGGRWPVPDRSVIATVLGVPPAAAVGLAAVLTALGVFVDLGRVGSLGIVFTVCHVAGCVLGVAWVRRNGLFGPMVAPPLLVALAVPVVVLLTGAPKPGAGIAERLIVIGAPLVNAFPVMAWASGAVLAIGVARIAVQRAPARTAGREAGPQRRSGRSSGAASSRASSSGASSSGARSSGGAARGAARTSRSPRRS